MSATLLELHANDLPWYLPKHQASVAAYDNLIGELAGSEEKQIAELHHTVQQLLTAYTIPVLLTRGPSYWTDAMEEWSREFFPPKAEGKNGGMKEAAEDYFWEAHATQATKATREFTRTIGEQGGSGTIQKPVLYLLQLWIEGGYRDAVTYNPAATNIMDTGDSQAQPAQEWFRQLNIWDDANPMESIIAGHITRMRDGMRAYTQEHTADVARAWMISSAILSAIGHGPRVEDTLHLFDGEAMCHSLQDAGIEDPYHYLENIHQELAGNTAFQAIMLEASAKALSRAFVEVEEFVGCNHMTRNAGRHVRDYREEQGDHSAYETIRNADNQHAAESCISMLHAAAEALRYHQTPQLEPAFVAQCRALFTMMEEAGYQSTGADWISQLSAASQQAYISWE